MWLGKKTNRIVRANLLFATGVIGVLTVLSLFTRRRCPSRVIGHEGSTVLVILNGLRVLRGPERKNSPTRVGMAYSTSVYSWRGSGKPHFRRSGTRPLRYVAANSPLTAGEVFTRFGAPQRAGSEHGRDRHGAVAEEELPRRVNRTAASSATRRPWARRS